MIETGVNFYSFYEITVGVKWEGEGIEDEIEQFFSPLPFVKRCGIANSVHIELKFTTTDAPLNIPRSASVPFYCYDLSICEADGHVYLTDRLSVFQLQLQAGTGFVTLHRSFKEKPPLSKYNFFLVGLIHLLSSRGFYDLHAAGLVRDGRGYLFLGESGSGKSSTALSLVRQGWHYVSDDALFLRSSADGIESLAFRKHFYLDPVLSRQFPEIAPHLKGSAMGNHTKRFLDVESVYPGRFRTSCIPKVLIYTQIVLQPESMLIPVDKTTAFIKLMRQSASLFFKRQAVNVHLEAIKRLVSQSDSYELLAGHDLYEKPEKISGILSGLIV
ncbi:hypothetical protein [Candidatus Kuenenia sp.]|uniref:hypothetical protein n=1 Tax=Candidatus Kuenenia sp. TaxID=2499824 RepID=UPI00321FD0B0